MSKKVLYVLLVFFLIRVIPMQSVNADSPESLKGNDLFSIKRTNIQIPLNGSYDSLLNATYSMHIKLGYQAGYGTFEMSPLKSINNLTMQRLPFDSKIVADYPGYLYFRPSIALEAKKYSLGLIFTYQSTGSRISAKDFSGEYLFDTRVRSIAPGIYGELNILSSKHGKICFYSMSGLLYSKLNIKESLTLHDTHISNKSVDFKAENFFLEPGFFISYSFGSLGLGLNAGYFITLGSQAFYTGDNKKNTLQDDIHQDIRADWNGIRAGLSVCYTFRSKHKE